MNVYAIINPKPFMKIRTFGNLASTVWFDFCAVPALKGFLVVVIAYSVLVGPEVVNDSL